ncbi:NAD(P)-dependent oxidoreductase [uncultured Tyzzerella sp.]|uniref:NAD-dependent epimerase/dehydratase family protein n=1 Tax=uncultured Tyzzerella sp. TaxID=2321398 RepID=UPI0029421E05|nr:NAD(P)-dependent oxidoreductase [uncultured Tyzzerella sp.]
MKKVIITGATSSIGIALIEDCIKNNVEVLALCRNTSNRLKNLPKSNLITVKNCDLKELENFELKGNEKFDVFYHLGWVYTGKEERNNVELQYKNIDYSINAINLANKLGCKKFIGAGSQAEYGEHLDKKTSSDSYANPTNAYGICKYMTGKLLSIQATKFNMDYAWVRIFSVYGKYDIEDTMISTTIKKLKAKEYCKFTPGEHIWDYLYSSDAGNAFYLLGKNLEGNKVYCLGSGKGKPLKEYIQIIKEEIDPKAKIGLGDIEYINGIPNPMVADISNLTKDTGFTPQIDFREGIRKILQK